MMDDPVLRGHQEGQGRISSMRQRPLTPSCAACARSGQPSHGFRHSVKCRNETKKWLDKQLGPPTVHELPTLEVTPEIRRITDKKSVEGQSHLSARMDVDTSSTRDTSATTTKDTMQPMIVENNIPTERHQVRRPADDELLPEDIEDNMVQVLHILQASESDLEEDYNQIMLENGDWCPAKLAWEGNLKEVQGLFDKYVFTLAGKQKPEGRYISMRKIRRWKADVIKSRLCLQDVARTRAAGGELYAATPSLTALRAALT